MEFEFGIDFELEFELEFEFGIRIEFAFCVGVRVQKANNSGGVGVRFGAFGSPGA